MNCQVLHLPFEAEGPTADMRAKVRFEEYVPSGEEIDEHWEKVGEDEVEGDADADPHTYLHSVWTRWNTGSGGESPAFARRECQDCDAEFTGEVLPGQVDLRVRQEEAERHERVKDHTVGDGTRSLSVGDIVILDDTAYLCQPVGWAEIGM